MNSIKNTNHQSYLDKFFSSQSKQDAKQKKKYLPDTTKGNLFEEILKNFKYGALNLVQRTVFTVDNLDNSNVNLQEYNIELPWNNKLTFPASINQQPYKNYILKIEEYIQLLVSSSEKSASILTAFSDFFDLLQHKIDFYNIKSNNSHQANTDIFVLVLKTIRFLEELNNLKINQQQNPDELTQLINFNTILIYACPEIADADILECFLKIANNPAKFKPKNIYQYLKLHVFNNTETFNLSLSSKYHFQAIYTFKLPKLAAFFLAINYNIKTDKHPVEKIIRRYDEFLQKMSDFFLHVNQVMYDKNIVFSDLSDFDKRTIIECSAKASILLAENGLLLEKADFSYLLSMFDSVIGGFFNNLNAGISIETQSQEVNKIEEKRYLLLIADDLINSLYRLPQILDTCIKNTASPKPDKKIIVSNIMQQLRSEISELVISHLDEYIMDLDHNFICNKLTALSIDDANQKAYNWKNTAINSLKNLDNRIDKDDFIIIFNEKIKFRKAILIGFSEIIRTLNQELGNNEHFLYDYCVAELINQVSTELNKEQDPNSTRFTPARLTVSFKRAYHSINQHINNAQDKFSKALLENCLHYSRNITSEQSSKKISTNKNNNQNISFEMDQLTREEYSATIKNKISKSKDPEKTTLEYMEENKQLLGTLICAYSSNEESKNSTVSLIERLITNKQDNIKKTKKYATNIHELTFKEISKKTNGKTYFLSASKALESVSEKFFRPNLSRDKNTLVAAENIRKKNYILMQEKDHQILKNLCQYALQKIKLSMEKSINKEAFGKLCLYLDRQIKNIDNITETRIIDPMKWLINALNAIYGDQQSDAMLKLKDDIQDNFNSLSNSYNTFLKEMYSKKYSSTWDSCLKNHLQFTEDKEFVTIIKNSKILPNQKLFITILFKIYDDCFIDIFKSKLAKQLPPSLETVIVYQKIMAFHLGNPAIQTDSQQINSDKQYNEFKSSIIYYNDHLKSLSEQMAFKLYKNSDPHANKLTQLDQTFKQSYRILQDKAISKMIIDFQNLSSNEETKKLIQQFNNQLDKLFELNFFEKHFGKQSRIFEHIKKAISYCSKNNAFIPGAFVAAAVVNMFFTIQGTALLRGLQKNAPKLFNAIFSMKQIFSQMETVVPGLIENASIVYALPLNTTLNSSCSADIYKNIKTSSNISFTGAINSAENNAISFLQSLYYKDDQGCPSGGSDSFPPGSFVNWPNAITTLVSISSGAIACFSGWAQDVDNYVKGVKEYSSLPNIFQDFSPTIIEKLLLMSAKQLPSGKQDATDVYPGATTASEFCLDSLDTLFNKTPKYTNRLSPMYALNWSIWALRYMTCGACSMAVPKRPHSLQEFKQRVYVAASDRKFKTLIRMLGYNSAKEFIDVFSTKSGTLAFLLFLKEADFFEAVNEKAGISDYQVMKAKYDSFIWSMDVVSKNTRLLNSYQLTILKETYGSELIDNLVDYNNIAEIEKSIQTQVNAMLYRVAGITSLGLIYVAQCANLYYYTFTPWHLAQKVVNKLQGKSVSLSDSIFENIISASKKTIKREYTPNNLSFEQQFWHYIFAERASSKFEQSFLLWGIKETINLSMYLNATAHERSMGINTVNWELLGCLIAYLLKDSTGMFARFATLLDNESLRTFFSLLDKLDSPLAEKVLSEIGRFGLNSPQSLNNTINSMMEEVIFTSTGDVNDIHRIANKKYQEMERIGITTFKKVSQLQEKEIEKNIESLLDTNNQNLPITQEIQPTKQTAENSPPYFQISTSNLRKTLQQTLVAHGMPIDKQTQKEVEKLDHFMLSNAYNIDYNNPLNLMYVLSELQDKVSTSAVDALLYQKIISKVRCINPHDKTQIRLQSLAEEVNRRSSLRNSSFYY